MQKSAIRAAATLAMTAALLSLAACQKSPQRETPPPAPVTQAIPPPAAAPAAPAQTRPARIDTLDDYKIAFAEQVMAANPSLAFNDRLPPMMRSIVVLDISIDKDGDLKRVMVHRSRNNQASQLAVGAVKRAEKTLPKPGKLLPNKRKTLDFSETFLFNDQFKFQIRTLAGPQYATPD